MSDFVTVIFVVAAGIRFTVSTNFLGYNNYYRTPIYRIFFPSLRLYYMAPIRDHRSAAGRKYSVGTYRKSTEIKSFFSKRIYIYIYKYKYSAIKSIDIILPIYRWSGPCIFIYKSPIHVYTSRSI